MNYLDQLNETQREAVTNIKGPVMVIAGPGSGKTRVLTYRIAHIIESGAAPWQILALTFTNKASREMRERIETVVGSQKARDVWAGTFHSLFARILRYEAEAIGYPTNFTIYDTDDTKSLLKALIKEMNLNKDNYNVNAVKNRISSAKTNLITPKLYAKNEVLTNEDRMNRSPHFAELYAKYTARCKRSGAMDFDDLLFRFYELLQNHEPTRKKYQERFQYVLVDEFQDTNYLQYEILKKLVKYDGSPKNVCIVGDDAQSIYAFRGATIENILSFKKDFPKTQIFKLEQNYRSTEHIVNAANKLITNNKNQIPKTIRSEKGGGNKIHLIQAVSDTEEGKRVADTIVEYKNRFHLSSSDIAILYRTNAQSRVFEEQLRRHNIQYRVFGGLSFYQRKEIKDLIAYLRLTINPNDDEALRRTINYPKRGIGQTTLNKVIEHAAATDQTLWDSLEETPVGNSAKAKLVGFKTLIRSFQDKAKQKDAYEAARFIADRSKLLKTLQADNTVEGNNRVDNLMSMLDGIQEFVQDDVIAVEDDVEAASDKSLAAYLQTIALMTSLDEDGDEKRDFVSLMSVHAAKGLEFPAVFVVGLEEDLFPSFMAKDDPNGMDEERRLFYVAITRAEQLLSLSFAKSRYRYGKMAYNAHSRFLEEIPPEEFSNASALRSRRKPEFEQPRAAVRGAFRAPKKTSVEVDLSNFSADDPSKINVGVKVLHPKFGEGLVSAVDGKNDNRIATISFPQLGDNAEKRIMLRFSKLQIVE